MLGLIMGEYISNRRYYTLVLFVVLLASITILAERGVFESINLDFDLSISGRSIYNSNFTLFEDQINKSYNENSVYLFKPSVDTNIKSLLVSGNVSGTGYAKVYLLINRELYPVAFFSLNNETINFSNICESTCSLPTLSDDKYVLRIEVDNVLLNLNTISYSEFDMDSSIDKVPNFSKESSQTLSTQKTNKKDSEPLLNQSLFQVLRPSDNWEDVDGIIDFKIKLNDIPLESCEIILNENLSYFADFKENQLIFSTELLDDGNYTWYANCSFLNNSFLSNQMNFTVNQNSSLIEIFEDVEDGLGNTQKVDIKIFIGDNLTFNLTENQHSKLIKKGNYNVELIPYNSPVKKIKVLNTSFNKNVNEFIDVDDVLGKTSLPVTKKWRQAYALNPIYKDSSYEITVIAKGEDLYKCKDWNYTERNCFGDWVKIMDLVPGDEYTFNLTPLDPAYGEGEDIFILKTIDIDGNVSDWDDILNTERNQIIDGIGGINDLDNPTTVDRDLIKFAYTWDDDYFYNYFERTTSGNLAVNLLVYLDLGNDGYMNSTDKVARYVWNGASNEIDIWIYDYVPSGAADILTGDGFDMPGTITNGILVEENLLGGSPSGSYAETRLSWSDIGIAPGTPIQFHVSSSRGINLPSQIEDNMDSRSTLLVFIDISPDQSSAGSKGDTIYYDLIITNDGNVEDTIDISTIGTLNGWTINFYQNDSVTPLNDSDSDGLIDVVLSPYTSTTIVAAVTIKASAKNGDLDQTYVYVNSSNDNSVYDYALLTTGVGAIYIYPSNYGKIASGTYIEYNHTLLNNRLQPDTINLQINVENGWYYELYNSTGGLLNDTNSDGLNDSGVMPAGSSKDIILRIYVPSNVSYGTIENTTITAISVFKSSDQITVNDITTISPQIQIYPPRSGVVGMGNYIFYSHNVSNNWNESDVFELSYDSTQNFSVRFFDSDRTTLLTDTNGDGNIDTGLIPRFGESKLIYVEISVPDYVLENTVDYTTIFINSSTYPGLSSNVTDNTTIRSLLTYDTESRVNYETLFDLEQTVYATAYGLSANEVYFVWISGNNTIVNISDYVTVNSENYAISSLYLENTYSYGTWILIVFDKVRDVELTRTNFYVRAVPVVNITNPLGGENWSGLNYINWTVYDLDATNTSSLDITIQYSSNGGISWNTITTLPNGTSPYLWNTSTVSDGSNYKIKVIAYDGFKPGFDISNTFTIDNTPPDIQFVNPTKMSGYGTNSSTNIEVNVTAIDYGTGLKNITIRLYNSSNLLINSTTSLTSPLYYNFTNLADGIYYYNATACDNVYLCNSTETRNFTIDTLFPQFYNYSDNNGTLYYSGIGIFNVTVINTNGTVYLEIDGTNVTATNTFNNDYTASYNFLSPGNYSYRWHSWGSGLLENYNVSKNRNYTVLAVNNTLPYTFQVVLNSTLLTNLTTEDLTCYAQGSDDNSTNLTAFYKWYKNGIEQLSGSLSNVSVDTLTLISTLGSSNTTKAEEWTCSIKFNDGMLNESRWNNKSLTILNSLPTIPGLFSPSNSFITVNRTPEFSWYTSIDNDMDPITYELILTRKSCAFLPDCSVPFLNITKNGLSSITPVLDVDSVYNWSVRAYDGEGYSYSSEIRNLTIYSLLASTLLVESVDFGYVFPREINTTEDNLPPPLLLQNSGNIDADITLYANQSLWTGNYSQLNTSYFQFKVDTSNEANSFDYLKSIINYTNVTDFALNAVSKFKWESISDTLEIDLRIEVPPDELAGTKETYLELTAE